MREKVPAKQPLLLALVAASLVLALCGCSNGAGQSSASSADSSSAPEDSVATESASAATESGQAEDGVISFDNAILLDDDVVTVELTQFFEKEVNWAGSDAPQVEKCFTVKVHNNTDGDLLFNINDAYINDEGVTVLMNDGNSGPAAGKTKSYSYDIQYNTSPDRTPLDSLEDLYGFEANIQTYAKTGSQLSDERNTKISFADLKGGGTAAAKPASSESEQASESESKEESSSSSAVQAPAIKAIEPGEIVTTENWEITFVGADLTSEVLPADTSGVYMSYEAGEGTRVLNLAFDVKCLAPNALMLSDALSGGVATYAGKYTYNTVEPYYDRGDGLIIAKRLAIDPLQTLRIDYLILNIPEEASTSGDSMTAEITVAGEKRSITVQ